MVCAPVYSRVLGLTTEVIVGPEEGVPHRSAVRCDFLPLMFKVSLGPRVGGLAGSKIAALDNALARALDLPIPGD